MLYGGEKDAQLLSVSVYDFELGKYRTINDLSLKDQNHAVNNLESISFKKTLRGDFEVKTRIKLTTDKINGMTSAEMKKNGFGGRNEKREWQLSEVRGYYFFVPIKLKFQCSRTIETPKEEEDITVPDEKDPEKEVPIEDEEPKVPDKPEKPKEEVYNFELSGPNQTFINKAARFEINTNLPRAMVTHKTNPSKNVSGSISYKGGYLTFSKEGLYTVTANLLGRSDEEMIEVIDPRPSADINCDRMKENVFSLLDGSGSSDNYPEYPINWAKSVWTIKPLGDLKLENLLLREEYIIRDGQIRVNELKEVNLKASKKGEVEVKLTVVNSIGRTHTKTKVIMIKEDKLPIASLYIEPTSIRSEIEDGVSIANVNVLDTSSSPDNDKIRFRKYLRVYDSNNDGDFSGECYEYFDGEEFIKTNTKYEKDLALAKEEFDKINTVEEVSILSRTNKVGLYLYDVYVSENELGPFVNSSKTQSESIRINEVVNIPPSTHFKASPSKKINIVILTDEKNKELSDLMDKLRGLEQKFAQKGYTAKLSVINSSDAVTQEKNEKIEILEKYQNQSIKTYSRYAHLKYRTRSFLHVVSIYRVPRSAYQSYYDSGFILNDNSFIKRRSNLDEEIKILYEYKEVTDDEVPTFDKSESVVFVKTKPYKNESGFKYDTAKYYPSDDPGNVSNIKIPTYQYYIGGAVSRSGVTLRGADVDNQWTISDKTVKKPEPLQSVSYSEGFDMLSEYEDDQDILIFYTKNKSQSYTLGYGKHYPFANTFNERYIKERLGNVEVYTAVPKDVLDLEVNDDKVKNFRIDKLSLRKIVKQSKNGTAGIYNDTQIDDILKKIYDKTPYISEEQLDSRDIYVIKDEEVFYKEYYSDYENDEKYSTMWKYAHEPIFESGSELSDISFENAGVLEKKINKFDKTGVYTITNTVVDNPDAKEEFSNYRKNSKESEAVNVIVHERPMSYFKSEVLSKGTNIKFNLYLKDGSGESYDPDNKSKGIMGLKSVAWFYRDSHGALIDITNVYGLTSEVKEIYEANIPSSVVNEKFEVGLKVIDDFGVHNTIYLENPLDVIDVDFQVKKEVYMGEELVVSDIVTQSSKEHDLIIRLYEESRLIKETKLMYENIVSKNDVNTIWSNQNFIVPQFDNGRDIKVETTIIERGGRSKTKIKYVYVKTLIKLEMFSVTGSWNHWKGGFDKLGNRLSVEPNRFMSYEKITIRAKVTGSPDNVEIDFDEDLKRMVFTDSYGNIYRYSDEVGKNMSFPLKLNKDANDIYEVSYIIPLTNSTKTWENGRIRHPYKMQLIINKDNVKKTYNSVDEKIVPYIEITGNIHDLMYVQPLK